MKREPDRIRKLLLDYEASEEWLFAADEDLTEENEKDYYHILLLCDEGLMTRHAPHTFRLTAQGHSFIEATRDDTIWSKTKEGARKIGGATLAMMAELAVAYLKQEAAEKLGIKL